MRMDCMRPIMGKRPRNTTRNTTNKKRKRRSRGLGRVGRTINARSASIAVR
jgi:hypothetical protein